MFDAAPRRETEWMAPTAMAHYYPSSGGGAWGEEDQLAYGRSYAQSRIAETTNVGRTARAATLWDHDDGNDPSACRVSVR